ncbi:MAG: GNAT family N-acetyltransferase [Deltaproteobacteria bacterium]|nr:GNAT family N-acetyltransferase [Deltaproteobacteria bacterium]
MSRSTVAFPFEADSLHLVAATIDGAVMGCVLFHPDGAGGGRLFQMAVDPSLQGQGIGRSLVEHLEAELTERGVESIELHARDHAVGFYAGMGYAPFGEPYEEVGIPHQNMRKTWGD